MTHEPDPSRSDNAALAWARRTGVADEIFIGVRREVRRRHRRRLGMAGAGVVVLALVALAVRSPQVAPPEPAAAPVTAVVAVPAKQTLPDGSTVELKDGAGISIEFGTKVRRVMLATGEAHFQVAKDAGRPFVVVASGIEIRAVGTAFSVQLGRDVVEVLVTEGTVAVESPRPAGEDVWNGGPERHAAEVGRQKSEVGVQQHEVPDAYSHPNSQFHSAAGGSRSPSLPHSLPPIFVAAGNRVTVDVAPKTTPFAPPVVAVSEAELAERLSWRVPRLRFSGTPVVEAVRMFNQYSQVQLVLGDAEIGKLKLSGILRADNTDSLVQLLHAEFGVSAEPRGDGEIVLRISAPPTFN